jgi:hypothetical protein
LSSAWLAWTILLSTAVTVTAQSVSSEPIQDFCVFTPASERANGLRIVFLSGDEEYRSEEAFPMLAKILARHHGFTCTVLFPINPENGEIDPENQANIPGMDSLDSADLIVMGWRFRNPPEESMKHFVRYLTEGKPIIGIRTSTHAFQFPDSASSELKRFNWDSSEWPSGFGRQVLGETWVAHHGDHGRESTRGIIEPKQANHPILIGVDDIWGPTDVYAVGKLPDDAEVLVRGQVIAGMNASDPPVIGPKNDPMMPLLWTRQIHVVADKPVTRIVCSTIGSADDFESAGLRRLLINACYWSMHLDSKINEDFDVNVVGTYKPSKFGFGGYQKGKTPRDYDFKSEK